MIRSLPRLWIAIRDMVGSQDLVIPTWDTMCANGHIVEHRIGPESALYEIDDAGPLALWVGAVDAQYGLQSLPSVD